MVTKMSMMEITMKRVGVCEGVMFSKDRALCWGLGLVNRYTSQATFMIGYCFRPSSRYLNLFKGKLFSRVGAAKQSAIAGIFRNHGWPAWTATAPRA